MNRGSGKSCRSHVLLCVVIVLLAQSAPLLHADPGMSRGLRASIEERLPAENGRDRVLQAVDEAVDNGYPEERLSPVVDKSLEEGMSAEALTEAVKLLDQANRDGLPAQPYADKIMEGLAKKVRDRGILGALALVDERIRFSARLLEKSRVETERSGQMIISTADAVAAGMDRGELRQVVRAMGPERINRRLEPEEVMEMVKTARGYGLDSREVGGFARSLLKDRHADRKDIQKFLDRIAYRADSDGRDDEAGRRRESIGSGGDDDGGDDGDDEVADDGSDDGDDGPDSSEEDDHSDHDDGDDTASESDDEVRDD